MRKENNGHCREKNEKLRKVKRAGESNCTPLLTGLNIIIFHDGLFNISYCHCNQQEKLENNCNTSF